MIWHKHVGVICVCQSGSHMTSIRPTIHALNHIFKINTILVIFLNLISHELLETLFSEFDSLPEAYKTLKTLLRLLGCGERTRRIEGRMRQCREISAPQSIYETESCVYL